jgi:GNAT superfamily N-acetyltransferase
VHDAAALEAYPKTVVLTDGEHVALRPYAPADRTRLEELCVRVGHADGARPGQLDRGSLVVLAVAGERLAGALGLDRADGALQVILDPDYRGRRLGTWMLLDAIHLAADLGMSRLVVRTGGGDEALRAALDRLDFQSEMVGAAGEVVMAKKVHRGWPDF